MLPQYLREIRLKLYHNTHLLVVCLALSLISSRLYSEVQAGDTILYEEEALLTGCTCGLNTIEQDKGCHVVAVQVDEIDTTESIASDKGERVDVEVRQWGKIAAALVQIGGVMVIVSAYTPPVLEEKDRPGLA